MDIRPIASGSSGNCYYVSDGRTSLLLDCGIPAGRIQEALWGMGKRLSDIAGCLVTHEHGDHVKAARRLLDMGVDIYASRGTAEAAGLAGHRVHLVQDFFSRDGRRADIGSLSAYAFRVEHDAAEPVGFVVLGTAGGEMEKLVYATDTPYLKYSFQGTTHLMIEANHDPSRLLQNAAGGAFPASHARRVLSSHMGIDTVLLTLERMDRSRLRQVWLLHLSGDNASGDFKRRVQEACGCEVYIAEDEAWGK